MARLWWIPTLFCALTLAAHFLRSGHVLLMSLCLLLPFMLLVRRPWSMRILQAALLVGSVEWLRSTVVMLRERMLFQAPWLRMVLIMGAVTLSTLLSAWFLGRRSATRWFKVQGSAVDDGR